VRIGEEEHPAKKKQNASGGPFVEDWSEGDSGAVRTGRLSFDRREIISLGAAGFQFWDGKTGTLVETISIPDVTGTLATKGLRVNREQIDVSPDRKSFVSFGRQPRPGTQYTDYWSMVHHRSGLDTPVALPGWIKENMLSGVLFLPLPNRLLRWGYKGENTQLDLIATDNNRVIDTFSLPRGSDVRHISPEGCAFIGWHKGVMALDCANDKLSPVCQLDLETAGVYGSGHSHYGVLTTDRSLWVVRSRFEGERTGIYRGRLSAWETASEQKLWSIEISELNPLWREIDSVSIHPNDQLAAISVAEREFVLGKFNRKASCVVLINVADGAPKQFFKAHRNSSTAYWLADGERLLTVSRGESAMKLWAV